MANPLSDLLNFQWPSFGQEAPPESGLAYQGPGSPADAMRQTIKALENPIVTKKVKGRDQVALRPPPVAGVMQPLLGTNGAIKFANPEDVEHFKSQGYTVATPDEYQRHKVYKASNKRVAGISGADVVGGEAANAALLSLPEAGATKDLYLGNEDLAARAEKSFYGNRSYPELDDGPTTDMRKGKPRTEFDTRRPLDPAYVEKSIKQDEADYQKSLEAYLDTEGVRSEHPWLSFLGGAIGNTIPLMPAGALGSLAFRGGKAAAKLGIDKALTAVVRKTVQREALEQATQAIAGAGAAGAVGSLANAPARLASQEHLGLDVFWDELKNAGLSALFSAGIGSAVGGLANAPGFFRGLKNQRLRTADIETRIKTGKYDFAEVRKDPEVQRVMSRMKEAQANVTRWQKAISEHGKPEEIAKPELPMPTDLEVAPWKYKTHDEAEIQQKLEIDARREQAIANLMPRPEREIFKSPYRWQGQQKAVADAKAKYGSLGDDNHPPPEVADAQQRLRDLKGSAPPEVKAALKTISKQSRDLEAKARDLGFSGDPTSPIGPEGGELAAKPRIRRMPVGMQRAQAVLDKWDGMQEFMNARSVVRAWNKALRKESARLNEGQDFGLAEGDRQKLADPDMQKALLEFERSKLQGTAPRQQVATRDIPGREEALRGDQAPWVGKSMFMEPIEPGTNLDELEAAARAKLTSIEAKMFTKRGDVRRGGFNSLQHMDRWDYEGAKQRLRQIDKIRKIQEQELKTAPINTMIDLALENVGAGKAKSVPEIVEYARKARVHLLGDTTPAGKVAASKLEGMIAEVEALDKAAKAVPRSLLRQDLIDEVNRLSADREYTVRRKMSEHGMLQEQANFLHEQQLEALQGQKTYDESQLEYAKRDLKSASDAAAREQLWAKTEGEDYVSMEKEIARLRAENAAQQQQGGGVLPALRAGAGAFVGEDGNWGALANTLTGIAAGTAAAGMGTSMLTTAGMIAGGSFASMVARNFFYGKGKAAWKAFQAARAAGNNAQSYRVSLKNKISSTIKNSALGDVKLRMPKASLVEIVSKAQFDKDREDTYKPPVKSDESMKLAHLIRQRAEEISHAAADPDGFTERLRQALAPARILDPEIVDRTKELWLKTINFLNTKMPRDEEPIRPFQVKTTWLPSDDEASTAARYIAAAYDPPGQLLDELSTGRVNDETIETMQALRPELWNWMRDRVLETLMDTGGKIAHPMRVALGTVFGMNFEPSEDPTYVNDMNLFVASIVSGEADQQQGNAKGGYTVPKRSLDLGAYSTGTIAGKFGG